MTDQEANNGVIKQEAAAPVAQASEASQSQVQKELSDKELNFKRLREEKERLERENQELRNSFKSNVSQKSEPEDDIAGLADDDLLTKKQTERLAEKRAKEIVEQVLSEREKQALPSKTKSKYSDFEEIVNKENVEEFERTEPELAQACASSPNPYEATYKMLKLLKNGKKKDQVGDAAKVVEEKPKAPLSSTAFARKGGLGSINEFGSMSKDQLYKEMIDHAKRA